jgi:hypothetical protein
VDLDRSATTTDATVVGSSDMSTMTQLPPRHAQRKAAKRTDQSQAAIGPVYWSEYNDPEDKADDDYYIYITPQESQRWSIGYRKIKRLFKSYRSDKESASETERLLPKLSSLEAAEEALLPRRPSSASSSDTSSIMSHEDRSRYGTFAYEASFDSFNDSISPLLAASMSLFLAAVLSVVLFVLRSVGRHRLRDEVDGVVSIGIVISLAFGALGAWGLAGQRPTPGRWAVVVVTYGTVLAVDAILATRLLNDVRKGL